MWTIPDLIDLSEQSYSSKMDPFDTPIVENASMSQQGSLYPFVNYHQGMGNGPMMSSSASHSSSSHSMPTNQQTLAERVHQLEAALQSLQHLPDQIRTPSWPPTTVTSMPGTAAPMSMYPSFARPPYTSTPGWYGASLNPEPARDLLCEPLIPTSNKAMGSPYQHTPTNKTPTPMDQWAIFNNSSHGVNCV